MTIIYIVIVSLVFVNIEVVSLLLHVVEHLSDMFDNGDPYDIIYLDIKKAFDQVLHKGLAVKFRSYGIDSKLHKWISCFLSNRLQWVKVGTSCSSRYNVASGIPQVVFWDQLYLHNA